VSACAGLPAETFFENAWDHDRDQPRPGLAVALAICGTCSDRPECLERGMTERFGVWGGTDPHERKKLRIARRLT